MLGSASNALADFASGNDLLHWCGGSIYDRGTCMGYIMAIADVMQHVPVAGRKACWPPNINSNQLRDVAIRYIETQPEQLYIDGANLVAGALATTFPCHNNS